ncbi:Na(+)-translocating NADH-quinone reductase subunit A [Maritimibacter alkaliphilus]|uniref:Na(+)-translocating NADH-quinone reductase subunit A n=1 Tax=Maritimibacter alkaliphilus TaxID=404236 RepID=UPI001C93CBB0|nr:Na(+)-translocating NADH-quinone reductase subunit A [Maritimibacter alkaliphilus]MBY6090713.1 Na(+)-translocating NADH-quinone reductase subunit A [Maritimibacter alkaliphilus]
MSISVPGPQPGGTIDRQITEEASLVIPATGDLRVEALALEGETVAQGQPLFRDLRHDGLITCAPMAGRVARLDIDSARRLRQVTLFHEPGAGRYERSPLPLDQRDLQTLTEHLRAAGLWQLLRARPFGGLADPARPPAAIFVMALDTRPGAPDPRRALDGQEAHFASGLAALAALTAQTEGPIFLCHREGAAPVQGPGPRIRLLPAAPLHPWGLAGLHIHAQRPATPDRPVWDIAAEDVAAIGALLDTGLLPETRLVSLTGTGLRETRLVRCQPWADLRGLCQGHVRPGQNTILSGSLLEGRPARWLLGTDRQATITAYHPSHGRGHWFLSALSHAARPLPLIPTAALEQSMGGALPAVALLRAIASGDAETAQTLGVLSLLPEDLALADYVTGAEPRLSALLAALLARMAEEEAA